MIFTHEALALFPLSHSKQASFFAFEGKRVFETPTETPKPNPQPAINALKALHAIDTEDKLKALDDKDKDKKENAAEITDSDKTKYKEKVTAAKTALTAYPALQSQITKLETELATVNHNNDFLTRIRTDIIAPAIGELEKPSDKVVLSSFLTKDDKGKINLDTQKFSQELTRLNVTNPDKVVALFPQDSFKDPNQEKVLQQMVDILKNPSKYPWAKDLTTPEKLPVLKIQVEANVKGEIVNEARQNISDKVDKVLENNGSTFLKIAESFVGRDLIKKILSDTGILGTLARMVLGVKIDLGKETAKLKTRGDFVNKFLNGKEEDTTGLRDKLKQLISLKHEDAAKNGNVSETFGSGLTEYQTTGEIEKQHTSHLLKDISGRFSSHIEKQSGAKITSNEESKDSQEITFDAHSPIEAQTIADFYAPEISGMDFMSLVKGFKGTKTEGDTAKKASDIADKLKGKDANASQKQGLPDHVLAKVEGTQITLTWSKMGLMERLKQALKKTSEEEKKPQGEKKPEPEKK